MLCLSSEPVKISFASKFATQGIQKFELSTQIRKGNSVEPVLNHKFEVVSVAPEGAQKDSGNNAVIAVNELGNLLK